MSASVSFRRNPEFVTQPLRQCRVMPCCRASISGQQEAADQMPAIHLAERIELNQASRMSCRRKMLAGGILVLHEALKPTPEAGWKHLQEYGAFKEMSKARDQARAFYEAALKQNPRAVEANRSRTREAGVQAAREETVKA